MPMRTPRSMAEVSWAVRRTGGPAVRKTADTQTARPPDRQTAIDRGVRIGIVYRPGVRPGMVVLPVHAPALDSARIILSRDVDYSDRFELITLPGGDSIRVTTTASGARPPAAGGAGRTGGGGAAAATTLNYPLYQALGADFAVAVAAGSGDSAIAGRACRRSRIPGFASRSTSWPTACSRRPSAWVGRPPRACCS